MTALYRATTRHLTSPARTPLPWTQLLPLVHPSNVLASSDLDELEARLRATYHSKGLLYVTNKYLELKVLIARAMRHAKSR
ncbi:hypothetical protein MAHJHV60_46880 [Mycobacterium avium subsp. hominissuis]